MERFGTGHVRSQDFMSTVLFHQSYIGRLLEIGECDGESLSDELLEFVEA